MEINQCVRPAVDGVEDDETNQHEEEKDEDDTDIEPVPIPSKMRISDD